MLSYQHIYHAGNPADLHKHALLAVMLARMTEKPKGLSYLETHSGRGLYDLSSAEALKTGEAAAGIEARAGAFAPDHPYMQALARVRAKYGATAYPGSPLLAAELLRPGDPMTLAELHPQEHAALARTMNFRAKVHRQDGYEMALSLCPPDPKRGLLLVDPSYEVKSEYDAVPAFVKKLHRKWNVGVVAIWYPILKDGRHQPMLRALESQTLPKVVKSEVAFPPVRDGHGMIGSGMFVINAPFGTQDEAEGLQALFGA
ncbi:23S rRNA (adenine(2030)-N(6))-methyltransferase RlmJ [Pseudooceanicola sp. CBS1P-1]|uniref:Ribosomal RNA large subunit methyltransferase J n=1 Tax=Pseudooceanicola albus TaxID=2692189 RepID=A0A6L7G4I8_9RHOB|nr:MULTISPECIES: 23S rRNA (adenine(2030)-N(6))-methyltransferase RlmJ [Pseudooceanicola]MBT9384578.1 23S rRNA (adenine(2030)-N(6))-methyltransferase RlmJ [Pseudooceanicola endophyticus]MXN18280.1 23S rRNA (adenine(2030)-N(6))-methyltransferase RlmJ [Pseudooceanicola albus]